MIGLRRVRLGKFQAASLATLLAVAALESAAAQGASIAGVSPEMPEPGSAFVVLVEVPGVPASDVEVDEPRLIGPIRYLGSDVRPAPSDPGSSQVELGFEAGADEGRAEIRAIELRIRGRSVRLGPLAVEVASAVREPTERFGSWGAPARAWRGAPFIVSVVGPDGATASSPPFATEGAVVEAIEGRPGRYRVVAFSEGGLTLPNLEAADSAGPFAVRPARVEIRPLPESAAEALAIGGPWRLALTEPRATQARRGDVVRWELRLEGPRGSPPPAAPRLRIEGPNGTLGVFGGGMGRPGRNARGETEVAVGGTFEAALEGEYRLIPEPYPWFDAETGGMARARGDAITVKVASPAAAIPAVPESIAALAALAEPRTGRGRLASAAAAYVAGSRGQALAEARRLEERAFPPPGARKAAAAMASASGNRSAPGRVLPPYGLPAIVALIAAFAAAAAKVAVARAARSGGTPARPGGRPDGRPGGHARSLAAIATACVVLSAASALLAAAGAYERAAPRFVSLGGEAKAAPSELASTAYELAEGTEGRIAASAGAWTLVEPFGANPAWARTVDLAEY